jgi:ATPase subunit of ABC transporter with duplicated ATPase domains
MILVNLHAITKSFGGRRILHELDFSVNEQVRIGLVGPNGAGKSTLLRILAGLEDVQAGEVSRRKGLRAAYLPQHVPGDERTPLELLLAARPELEEIEQQLRRGAASGDGRYAAHRASAGAAGATARAFRGIWWPRL